MMRRLLAAAVMAAAWTAFGCAHAQTVAITLDDGPDIGSTPRMTAQERNQALLAALARHRVQAALFVTSGFGANTPEGFRLLEAWSKAGHAIGNHTVTHPDLHKVDMAAYQKEVLDCDRLIGTLPGYRKWLRFTYLREGNTPEKRDGMRNFLREQGYRNAYVSLDTSDWRLNEELVKLLNANPDADVAPIRAAYLAHVRQRAEAYRALSRQLQGRDIAQVLLLHHNLINALWLGDVIAQFKEMGWTIVSPQQAFEDPVYALLPERAAPGQSLLLSMGRTLGLGRFPGGERLMDDADFEVEQLRATGALAPQTPAAAAAAAKNSRPFFGCSGGGGADKLPPSTTANEKTMSPFFSPAPLLLANAWDVPSALAAESAGYRAIGTSSAAIAAMLGYQDGEQMPFEALLLVVRRIRASTALPLSVDIEAGYGTDTAAIIGNVSQLAELGVAGINIEDSRVHDGRRELLPPAHLAQQLRSLRASFPGLFMNARTDTFLLGHPGALPETLARGSMYRAAGADGLFVPCITAPDDIRAVTGTIDAAVNVMCMPGLPDFATLAGLGVRRISMGNFVHGAVMRNLRAQLDAVQCQQTFAPLFADEIH